MSSSSFAASSELGVGFMGFGTRHLIYTYSRCSVHDLAVSSRHNNMNGDKTKEVENSPKLPWVSGDQRWKGDDEEKGIIAHNRGSNAESGHKLRR